jgi:hypothetical protein
VSEPRTNGRHDDGSPGRDQPRHVGGCVVPVGEQVPVGPEAPTGSTIELLIRVNVEPFVRAMRRVQWWVRMVDYRMQLYQVDAEDLRIKQTDDLEQELR